ncbi:MAG TPA: hypothetical protein VFC28_05075 [Opitutaceae bacterium]|jgi:hypothetical protein|nr:hypothetical protein [Opitutaceae bacterium]
MSSEKREYPTIYDLHLALSAYARESRAPFQQLRQSLREAVRRIFSEAPLLEQELKEIQRRLGTSEERPDDMPRAALVGHELTNMMCLAVLVRSSTRADQG